MNLLKMTAIYTAILYCVVLLDSSFAHGANDVLARVSDDLRERQNAARAVRYVVEGKRIVTKGALSENPLVQLNKLGELPRRDSESPIDIALLIDFEKSFLRKEHRYSLPHLGKGHFKSLFNVSVFNKDGVFQQQHNYSDSPNVRGKELSQEELLKLDPMHIIQRHEYATAIVDASMHPILFAHGIVPTDDNPVEPSRIRIHVDSLKLKHRGEGVVDNQRCVILRTAPNEFDVHSYREFWVDLSRNSAILRELIVADDHTRRRIDVKYKQTKHGWLPNQWTNVFYGSSDVPAIAKEFRVTELEMNPKFEKESFRLDYFPGTFVQDVRHNRRYIVGEDGQSLVPYFSNSSIKHKSGDDGMSYWIGLLVVNGALLPAGLFLGIRHLRNSPKETK